MRKVEKGVKVKSRWKPLEPGHVKINWNVAFNQASNRMRCGIAIGDEHREPLAMLSCNRGGVSHPLTVGIWILWRALKLCDELNFINLIFEGDALVFIKAISSMKDCWTCYGQLIEDIQSIIQNKKDWLIQYTCEDCNNVTHTIAEIGLKSEGEKVWIEECPVELKGAISFDRHCWL